MTTTQTTRETAIRILDEMKAEAIRDLAATANKRSAPALQLKADIAYADQGLRQLGVK
jgi:hypothetical protein